MWKFKASQISQYLSHGKGGDKVQITACQGCEKDMNKQWMQLIWQLLFLRCKNYFFAYATYYILAEIVALHIQSLHLLIICIELWGIQGIYHWCIFSDVYIICYSCGNNDPNTVLLITKLGHVTLNGVVREGNMMEFAVCWLHHPDGLTTPKCQAIHVTQFAPISHCWQEHDTKKTSVQCSGKNHGVERLWKGSTGHEEIIYILNNLCYITVHDPSKGS